MDIDRQGTMHSTPQATLQEGAPLLRVRLLGAFGLTYGAEAVDGLNTARLQSLFAYLALHRDTPHLRQHLAFLFWPDSNEAQARNNLRQMLHALRYALPAFESYIVAENSVVRWRPEAPVRLDVTAFEDALSEAEAVERQGDMGATISAWERANALYRGDLLPSCYDPWIAPERERLRRRSLETLNHLVQLLETQRRYPQALTHAEQLLQRDRLNEASYREVMRLHAHVGDRTGVARVYHECVAVLRRELDMAPSQATQAAYHALLVDAPPPEKPPPAALSGSPTLIGRQREWSRMRDAWALACATGPGFLLVTGEAGIGKSRLLEELRLAVGRQERITAKTRSYAAEGRLSLAPVADWLRCEGLRPQLGGLDGVWLAEVARILPELLSAYPDLPPRAPMSEFGQRQRFFEALARAVLAAPQPLLLLIDDLQWCDKETLEWLRFLLRFDATARVLIVGSVRTEDLSAQHPLQALLLDLRATTGVTEIALAPLDAAETAALAAQLTAGDLGVEGVMRLYHETEGNPLFVVETVRAGLEYVSGAGSGAPTTDEPRGIPPKVQAMIAGRLAQLSLPARELVALSATMGRAFGLDALAHASGSDEEQVASILDELWQRRIIREQGANRYDFTHDKLREVAYAEIGAPQRRLLHRRIALALEALHADDLDIVSGQIATHYDLAGQAERAIPYYERAAEVALRVYANEDAIGLLSRSLALLGDLPGGSRRDARELALLLKLSPIYRVTRGWTAPELERLIDRTLALCDTVGDDRQRMSALYGQQSLLTVQAKLEKVQVIAEELQALYQRAQGSAPPLSRMMQAGAWMYMGRLRDADEAFQQIISGDALMGSEQLREAQGWDFQVHTRAWQAHGLWTLGYPDRAITSGRAALQLAHDLAQPFNQALASTYFAMFQQMCAAPAAARAQAEAALTLTIEYKAPYYHLWSQILAAYALALESPDTESIERLRVSITNFTASGARLRLPYYLWLLARVYADAGAPGEGLAVLDEALAEARANSERWWDAELHRLRGELLLARGADPEDVESALLRAVEIARGQSARSLELRAAVSLARHWRARDRVEEARRLLREVYGWFTEGFATPDLLAARTLLDQLDQLG